MALSLSCCCGMRRPTARRVKEDERAARCCSDGPSRTAVHRTDTAARSASCAWLTRSALMSCAGVRCVLQASSSPTVEVSRQEAKRSAANSQLAGASSAAAAAPLTLHRRSASRAQHKPCLHSLPLSFSSCAPFHTASHPPHHSTRARTARGSTQPDPPACPSCRCAALHYCTAAPFSTAAARCNPSAHHARDHEALVCSSKGRALAL